MASNMISDVTLGMKSDMASDMTSAMTSYMSSDMTSDMTPDMTLYWIFILYDRKHGIALDSG